MKRRHFLLVIMFALIVQPLNAQVPSTISYQGFLKNSDGTTVSDDTYSITFKLYDEKTDGTEVWTETQSVSVSSGIFSAILGKSSSLEAVAFDDQYWLGITVGSGSEMTPRTKLTAVPYSINTKSIPDDIVTEDKIKDNAVSLSKISSSGAGSGQAIVFDGSNITWSTVSSGGTDSLSLPYDGSLETSKSVFQIENEGSGKALKGTNSGTGEAGYFQITNSDNSDPALYSQSKGTGQALKAYMTGSGKAGYFEIYNSDNSNQALYAKTNGTGQAGYFYIDNSSNNLPAIYSYTNGSGEGIEAVTTGSGAAAKFEISNSSSESAAIIASTDGTGHAGHFKGEVKVDGTIESTTGGIIFPDGTTQTTAASGSDGITFPYTGSAETTSPAFSIINEGSGTAVKGKNTGTGEGGWFQIQNSSSSASALYAKTNGTGAAVKGYATGKGEAGYFQISNSSSSASALYAETDGDDGAAVKGYATGEGEAGYFQISNSSSTASALYAETNGRGGAAVKGYATGEGHAGYFQINNSNSYTNVLYAGTDGEGGGSRIF